ncbi:uncharacterized protein [Argopecten irradians]|uniref:uncharacterized protein isoform X2 n=1 Tax=Argopecten irradians TaxID=31199 RepID=UPI00371D9261
MFDQFPSKSGLSLWPDPPETNNEFMYYLCGGLGIIYLMCLILAYSSKKSKSSIIVVTPNEEVENEKLLHKYLLVLSTSLLPGSSCSSKAKVFIQLVGKKVKSNYNMIKVFSGDRFLFQRGNKDIILIRTKEYLGPLHEVKIVVSTGLSYIKWRPYSALVTCMTTGNTYPVDCRLINPTRTAVQGEDGIVFPYNNRRSCSCHAILRKIATFHPWLSPFNVPLRFGNFSQVDSTNFIFLALTLLMALTLVGYILTSTNVTETFSMEVEFVIMAAVTVAAVSIVMYLLSILLRNVKSGKKEIIDELFPKSVMIEKCTDEGNHVEKQVDLPGVKASQVQFSITHFPSWLSERSSQSVKSGDQSDTDFKSFMSIDMEREQNIVPDKQTPNLEADDNAANLGIGRFQNQDVFISSTDLDGENKETFKSTTGFEVCSLKKDSCVELSSDQRIIDSEISFTSLEIEPDSNNSADKDSQNSKVKSKNEKSNTSADNLMHAYGGTAERNDSKDNLDAEMFLDVEAESDMFLDVASSESKMKGKSGQLRSVSADCQGNIGGCLKDFASALSLPSIHTMKQHQMPGTEMDQSDEICKEYIVQNVFNTEEDDESLGKFLQNSCPNVRESKSSLQPEDGSVESLYARPMKPLPGSHAKEYYTGPMVKEESEALLSCDEVSIHMDNTEEADEDDQFWEIDHKASSNLFYPVARQSSSISDSEVRDELLQTKMTEWESDEVQKLTNKRNTQLHENTRRLTLHLMVHFCEIRRSLLTKVDSSMIYQKTKLAAHQWLTMLLEEQFIAIQYANRMLTIQRNPCAVRRISLGGEVPEWPLSLTAQCVRQCIQHVCDAMTLPQRSNYRERLDKDIKETLTGYLHESIRQFYDHHKETVNSNILSSVSTESSTVCHQSLPGPYVSQSSPEQQLRDHCQVLPRSAENLNTFLHEISSFYMECVQTCILIDKDHRLRVCVSPVFTCSTEHQKEVQVLLDPPQLSRSFIELSIESQLYRVALTGAKNELWLEYEDPISVYTAFLMQKVTLDKLKTMLTWCNPCSCEENLTNNSQSHESFHVKDTVDRQAVKGTHGLVQNLKATLSGKLASYSGVLSQKLSLLRESKSALITMLTKKSDANMKTTIELHPLIPFLDKKWHRLGFHRTLNVKKNLTQALMSKLVKDLKRERAQCKLSENHLLLGNISCLYRIEKQIYDELDRNAEVCFEQWCPYIQQIIDDNKLDSDRTRDQICAVVDVASQKMLASLESIVTDLVQREIIQYKAAQATQMSICQTDKIQVPETDDGETVTSYEMNFSELIKEFQPMKTYLSRVTQLEKVVTKELIQVHFYERYQRKHDKFAAITFQHVLDSYYEKDPDMMDTTLTNVNLQQLEWHILGENTKVIPGWFGRLVTFVMFCLTVFGLVYVTLTGSSLSVTQIQEWMACFCISVALYAFVFEPFVSMVGYLGY